MMIKRDFEILTCQYLGSPALALNILKKSTNEFIFFDIDEQALKSIQQYAKVNFPNLSVNCENQDSIVGIRNLLPSLTQEDFIFFDPYQPFHPGKDGDNYIKLFFDANLRKIPSVLWYGFDSLEEKKVFDETISNQFIGELFFMINILENWKVKHNF